MTTKGPARVTESVGSAIGWARKDCRSRFYSSGVLPYTDLFEITYLGNQLKMLSR